ncbi:protein kinase domain, Nitrogen network kinase 1, Phloem protein 2-like protein [Artemisia annua]|uniref:Protein kinase domain, Nitrogen network kinase 1, Phloem protein 2-like protein n=1 Tax=Artemisia annua TaxID=35608 RepID=A0A2U1NV46_ARTAN|nr:protein kinase domain, Nitrogen network kinase 1, Phloem protein 2-like protein [Artemisia annua]
MQWFSINDKGEHIERIYIEACLNPTAFKTHRRSREFVDSRFPGVFYHVYDSEFNARVRAEYLSPQITYTVNLVFRYSWHSGVNSHNPLRYKLNGENETKILIVDRTTYMIEDQWLIVPLYQFTRQDKIVDLQFVFEYREIPLLVVGFEFQPLEEKAELSNTVFEEYQGILKAASQSLVYKSFEELKEILFKGIHLNGYNTWFSLNEKGEHCHMISMKDCLIPNADFTPRYWYHWCSRFPAGLYLKNNNGFKTHAKTQLLSPSITYTVNLVYKSSSIGEQVYVDLKYRLREETTTYTVYLANKREGDGLYMAELYQFTSHGRIFDLEINFDDHGINIEGVEGILFQPLETVEDQVSKVENIRTISDSESDTYWEQKFPNDFEEILNLSKYSLMWTTKKELYSILRRGFLINNGQEWFTVDKQVKKCLMLSAKATWVMHVKNSACESSHESRFGEVLVITAGDKFELVNEIKPQVLSADTTYGSYFVYKLPQEQSSFEDPLEVNTKYRFSRDVWFVYLVSPPGTPVIRPNFDANSYNPLNRHKLNAVPRQRSDGWMEVKVWQFDTRKTPETVSMHLKLKHPVKKDLSGLIVQGIELRPL